MKSRREAMKERKEIGEFRNRERLNKNNFEIQKNRFDEDDYYRRTSSSLDEFCKSNNSSSSQIDRSVLKERVRDVFEFIYADLLADFDRETLELEKRRIRLENKQNQFRAILRRFENDVRAMLADEDEDKDEWRNETKDERKFADFLISPISSDKIKSSPTSPIAEKRRWNIEKNLQSVPIDRQIFVGGLPSKVHEEELSDIFSSYGRVIGVKILPKIVGKNACAFVAFDSSEVVRDLLNSPPLFSNYWPENQAHRLYIEAKCSTTMAELPDEYKIHVTNLRLGTRLVDVKNYFDKYGKVVGAKLRYHRGHQGQKLCCAFVAFESTETASRVAECGTLYFGKFEEPIQVKPATALTKKWHK